MTSLLNVYWSLLHLTKIFAACIIRSMFSLFICSGTSLVGALTVKTPMIQKVVFMLIIWETLEDHRKFLNTRLKIALICKSKTVKIIPGSYALMAFFVKSVIPLSRSSTIQNSTREKTAIAKGAISKRYVHSTMDHKRRTRLWRMRKSTGSRYKESITI